MKKKIRFFILVCGVLHFSAAYPQGVQRDTLKVMTYNTLNYGFPATSSCPGLASWNKHRYLRTIVQFVDPDILGLVKMNASPASFSTDTVLHEVLDSVCSGCYNHVSFTNFSGYTKENMLFFKNDKIGFSGTTTIYSGDPNISDINLHRLYYKSSDLPLTHDTVFINVILAHLKSGSGNANDRANEITGVMNWLNANVNVAGNYIFMGDLNTQSSNETCFQALINSPNINTRFSDPENHPGNWSDSSAAYSHYLTQSTRLIDPGDCGATGGMNDRFDHILCSQSILSGTDSVNYIPGSFEVVGQDGHHSGVAISDAPSNSSVPPQVLNALYYMSNHLPVTVQLAISSPVTGEADLASLQVLPVLYNHVVANELLIQPIFTESQTIKNSVASIYNLEGHKLIEQVLMPRAQNRISTVNLSSGVFILQVGYGGGVFFKGKLIKIPD